MATCNDCFHYEACKKIFQIAFKDFTDYTFVKACELYKPTADVVEVVRCKDCRFCKFDTFHKMEWCTKMSDDEHTHWVDKDFYCGHGKRKEDK